MMVSKIKTITLLLFFAAVIPVKSVNTIDTYCAKLWPHYSLDKQELETFKDYCDKANSKNDSDPNNIRSRDLFFGLGYIDQKIARTLEEKLAVDVYSAIKKGKVLSQTTYDFIKEHEARYFPMIEVLT